MKVAKPIKVPILHRVIEIGRRPTFHVAAMIGFPLAKPRALLDEMAFWALVSRELGEIGVVDEGVSKSRGELVVAGSFHAPGGAPVTASYVRASVGGIDKRVAVVGDRFWNGGAPTAPVPFTTMPIDWAHAFGGPKFDRNPYGKGAEPIEKDGRSIHPLPNLENYGALIRAPSERPEPAGLSSMDVTFTQRRKRAGTYDKRWVDEHFPGMAPDMDPAFYNLAQPDQWAAGFFRGDESFFVENMHADSPRLEGKLPGLLARTFVTVQTPEGDRFVEIPMRCDTVWLLPSAASGVVILHGSMPIRSDDAGDIVHLVVGCEEVGASPPRPLEHYQRALARRVDKDKAALTGLSDGDLMPPRESGVAANLDEHDITRWVRSERIAARNMRRGQERDVAAAQARMAAQGLDPSPLALPPEPPAVPEDPDELADFMAKQQEVTAAAAAKLMEGAEEKRVKILERAREQFKATGKDFDAMMEQALKDAAGPPKFSAKAHIERVAAICARGRASGMPSPMIEQQLADPAFRNQLEKQEEGMREMYRTSAHIRPTAAPVMDPEASARVRILIQLALETGEALTHRDFTGANLSGMQLREVDFSDSFLEGVDFSGCDLTGAKFDRAVLARANLRDAILKGAKLSGVNLGASHLECAVLDEADLTSAVLSRANLEGACFAGATLAGVDWMETTFGENDFSGAVFEASNFIKVKFVAGHFAGADLTKATFIECELDGADFSRATLHKASFLACRGDGVVFRDASFRQGVMVHGSSFPNADLRDADLEKANFRGTVLTGARFDRANLTGADLSECDVTGGSFERAALKGGMLIRTRLDGASLRGANLMDALASKAHIPGADFTGANLFRADLSRVVGDPKTSFADAIVAHVRYLPKADVPPGERS